MNAAKLSEMIDRAIIDLISDRVIAVLQGDKKCIAVLFTGNDCRVFFQALPQLQALSQQNYRLSLLFSYSAKPMLEQNQAVIAELLPEHIYQPDEQRATTYCELINQSHLLLAPGLSLNTLAKSALGICDSIPSQAIAHALLQGKRVVASQYHSVNSVVSPAYIAQIKQHITQLQAFGVDFVEPSALVSGIELSNRFVASRPTIGNPFNGTHHGYQKIEQKKRLISLRDVLLHDPSRPLFLTTDMLLTPAARDEINKRKIQLINRIGDEYVSR